MSEPPNVSGLMDQIHELKIQLADAEKRGAAKALRGFAVGFAVDNDPTSKVLAGRVASDLMDRAHLIEHGEVDLDGTRIESGGVTL